MRSFNINAACYANLLIISAILGGLIGNLLVQEDVVKSIFDIIIALPISILLLEGMGWKRLYTKPLNATISVHNMKMCLVAGTLVFGLVGYLSYSAIFALSAFCILSIASAFDDYMQNTVLKDKSEKVSLSIIIARGFDHRALKSDLFRFAVSMAILALTATTVVMGTLEAVALIPLTIMLLATLFVTINELSVCIVDVAKGITATHIVYGVVIVCALIATGCGATLTSTVEVTHAETKAFDCYKTQQINGKTFLLAGKTGQNSLRIADTGNKIAKKMAVKGYSCVPTHVVVPMAEVECGSLLAQVIGGRCVIK